jgi:cytochrome c-type protein NapC
MKKIIFLLSFGIVFGLVLSLGIAEMISRTGDRAFCASCHTMEPVALSYAEDIHGGNNKRGFSAECVDCHLPHDNVAHFVIMKAIDGTRDALGEMFLSDSYDWIGNLENRIEFTYPSGCVKCHDLSVIRYDIPKAFLAHRDFLSGKVASCVKCHEHVGHKNIQDFLVLETKREEK